MPTAVVCPHCSVSNAAPGKFCASCGRALPSAEKLAPRVISGKGQDFAQSGAGQAMQMDELGRQARAASKILMVLGGLVGFFGAVMFLISMGGGRSELDEASNLKAVGLTLMVLSAIYFGLGAWAKKNPLPASITGLVMYTSLAVVGLVQQLSARELPPGVYAGYAIEIAIIAALARAVAAGMKHRELSRRVRARAPGAGGEA